MEERRYIRLVNSCRSYPASYSRIDASDSGICPIQTRRRHRTFIWLDWMAPWLPVLPVTAKGSHTRGRIMYEWNGRDQLGQIKHLSCVGVSTIGHDKCTYTDTSELNSRVPRTNHLRLNQSYYSWKK